MAELADVATNEVRLVGRLSESRERRVLPSGDEVLALIVAVDRPDGGVDAIPVQVGPAPGPGRRPTSRQVGRRELAASERLPVGATVEVTGSLRRRWWAGPTGGQSRVEVTADSVRALAQ